MCGSCAAKWNTITQYELGALNAGKPEAARKILDVNVRLQRACKAPSAHDGRRFVSQASALFLAAVSP